MGSTASSHQGFLQAFRDEFRSEKLLPGVTAGLLMGVKEVVFALSVGTLIFSGDLAPYLAYGIGIALITQVILLAVTAIGGSVPGVIGGLQDSSSVILAVIAAAIVGGISAATMEARLLTVLVAIASTTLLTGLFFLALGSFKLGGLVRFIPYPVVGGFLAGTGWLLMQGSFVVMAGFPLGLSDFAALLQPGQLLLWVPGVLLALMLLLGSRYAQHYLTMPAILIGAFVLFYLALLATGTSVQAAVDRGLLLGGVTGQAVWQPLAPQSLLAADWSAILGQGGNMAIILLLSVVGLLLNASGIELAIGQDVDLNRELRVAGIGNILSGLGGGAVGYHALDLTTLCVRIGVRGRLAGLVTAAICGIMLFAGAPLLSFFPKAILGGLLLFLGLDFLVEWVIDGWSKLPRADYAVVLLILVVIGATDFLVGVAVGLVAMVILFVVNYSRISVIHHTLSGAELASNVGRPTYHQRRLRELGQHIYILELRGFIFFGTANALLDGIRARLADPQQLPVRFIVLDFRRVTGLDSSAVLSFVKARQLAAAQEIALVLAHVSEEMQRQFELGGLTGPDCGVRIFPDLDHGLEWCENRLLDMERVTLVDVPVTLRAQLAENGFDARAIDLLLTFLERVRVPQGEHLIRQGEQADDLYFIEQGAVSVYLEMGDGRRVRLHALSPGTVVGEVALYLGTARTASVIADSPAIVYRLTQTALRTMKAREPELAASFHELVARLLSERLAATDRALEAVLR